MTQIKQCVSLLFLLALLTSTTALFAQDSDPFTVVGSGIVNPVVESLAEANETDAISIVTTGTPAGFEQFCAGEADVMTATRAISADEDANCISNEITYSEFLVGHSILTFIAHPTVTLSCLTETDFDTLFAPSATDQINNWSSYDESVDDLPITFILPQDNTVEYVIFDNIVNGDGLRRDIESFDNPADAIEQVESTEGAIALIPYNSDVIENDAVKILEINYDTTTGCASPSAENVENRLYKAAQPLFLYVNRTSLDNIDSLEAFMTYVTNSESGVVVNSAGFVAPTDATYEQNTEILINAEEGRLFSGTESSFTIPDNLIGQIDISGSANAYTLLDTNANQLTSANQQLTINITAEGQAAGIRRLCNGETDIAILQSNPADIDLAGCQANDINTVPFVIGTQATVLVANEADTHLSCLTTEQITTIWGAGATDTITNWSDVDESFPDQDMTLFGPSTLSQYSDILLASGSGVIEPIRRDTEQSNDALFRAAAVGNVEGALTYMSWLDYQRVVANNQQNIQLVSVDGGEGCILPIVSNVAEGEYSLSRPAYLLVNELSLTDISVQSFIWKIFSDQGWSTLEREGFVGIGFGDLPAVRNSLETEFSLAEANIAASVATPDAESTAEPEATDTDDGEESSD